MVAKVVSAKLNGSGEGRRGLGDTQRAPNIIRKDVQKNNNNYKD